VTDAQIRTYLPEGYAVSSEEVCNDQPSSEGSHLIYER